MRFVPVKSAEQQAILSLHRARKALTTQRTALVNQLRGLLGEYGIVIPQGRHVVRRRVPELLEDAENELPDLAREVFAEMLERLRDLDERMAAYDRRIQRLATADPMTKRMMALPGIGAVTATALSATVGDFGMFRNGRQLAAWLGLVPRQHTTGGRPRHGRITKRGDAYQRTLLIHRARAALRRSAQLPEHLRNWLEALRERRGPNKAAVALAAQECSDALGDERP